MSNLFTLVSTTNVLSTDFLHPIQLDENAFYGIALISLNSYNSIPNIEPDENTIWLYDENDNETQIEIPTGSYEIADIESYVNNKLKNNTTTTINKKKFLG